MSALIKTMTITISIDCMGGDHGPAVTVAAAVSFVNREPEAALILVGLEEPIQLELKKHKAIDHPRLSSVNAYDVVTIDDPLEGAGRRGGGAAGRGAGGRGK